MRVRAWSAVFSSLSLAACFGEPDQVADPTGSVGATETGSTSEPTTEPTGTSSDTTASETSGAVDESSGDESSEATGEEPLCGNGVLDPGEQCDGTNACTDCKLDNWLCNPLNNAGCPAGQKCSLDDSAESFRCVSFSQRPPGALHDDQCWYSGGPNDEWCDVGLLCIPHQYTGACSNSGGCCVEYCDLADPSFICAQDGDTCRMLLLPAAPAGLEWLGACMSG